ncbi:MAG: Zn-dependent hydrolase [Eubacteriales bacterium]|nr:Zn-dependent hydrolase [Eubacteriales bacterium]
MDSYERNKALAAEGPVSRDTIDYISEILEEYTLRIGSHGKTEDGSYSRLPLSPEYEEAAEEFREIAESLGMTVTKDRVGDRLALLEGTDPEAGTIVTGSHLDTVLNGGLYDGCLGVAASLSLAKRLLDEGVRLRHSLLVMGIQGEEGSALGGTFGSRAMMGLIGKPNKIYQKVLDKHGLTYDDILSCQVDTSDWREYLELHIEQSTRLEKEEIRTGIVTGIAGITRYRITVNGKSDHAGTTRMRERHDALVAAAKIVQFVNDAACDDGDHLVATIGMLRVSPGAATIIPGKVTMTLEVRHMRQAHINDFVDRVKDFADSIDGVTTVFTPLVKKPSVVCDKRLRDILARCGDEGGISHKELHSGAGQDSNAIGQRVPVAMIFVPSKNGIGHCKEEYTSWEDAAYGTDMLYRAVLKLDQDD